MSQEQNIQDEIAKVAYELFENSGRMYGNELGNWLAAEEIVMKRYTREKQKKPSGKTKPKKH